MSTRVGINGFGRIGRSTLRAAIERGADIEWAGVNDVMDAQTAARLLRHDSTYGPFAGEVEAVGTGLLVDGVEIPFFAASDPTEIPWSEVGAEVVIESTGRFRTREAAATHLAGGARKVVISAPAKGGTVDATVVLGVNFDEVYDPERHDVISIASCTTNCLAPAAKVLHDGLGIRHGLMTTIHAYTGDQNLQDGPHSDPRRARAAGINIVPTSTGAAKALGLVIPELEGKLHGYALRVPVVTGSVVDLTVEVERPTTADEVNDLFAQAAGSEPLASVLAFATDPLVSTDIVKSPYSSIFDSGLTSVIDGTNVKVVAWYDNEWGYSSRLVDVVQRVLAKVPASA
jgi:glyceraldehyde 3-phosphate dehydrogenase (phosphorylating)